MGWQDATPLDAPAAPTEPKKSGWRGAIPLDQPAQKAGWQSAIPLEAAAPQPWERGEKAQVIQGPPAASQPQGYFEKSWEHLKEIPRDIGQMAKESITGAPERFRSGWQDAPTIMKPFVGASRAILDAPLVQGANEAMMGDLGMGMSATERAVGGERAGAAVEKAAVSMVQTGKDVHDTPGLDQFELRGTDNKPIGYMTSEYDPEKKNLHVWWVGKTRDEPKVYPASDANTVGPKLFRQALPQLRELYPDLKTISGTRTGGARAAAAPDFRDTRGGGVQYHGAGSPNVTPAEGHYTSQNYYGQGFYTTDAVDIAHGYSKKGAKTSEARSLYKATPKGEVKLYNMESPIAPKLKQYIDSEANKFETSSIGELFASASDENPKNLREFYDNIRDSSGHIGASADTVQEAFAAI